MGVLVQEMRHCPSLHSGKSGRRALSMVTVGSSIHHDRALTNEEREQSLDSMIRCALELAAEAAEAAEEAGQQTGYWRRTYRIYNERGEADEGFTGWIQVWMIPSPYYTRFLILR